jgi:predicted nucleotidyltransferase
MIDALRRVIEADGRVAYAILFGSMARQHAHAQSDVDVAVGFAPGVRLDTLALGELTSRLETAAGRPVDLVVLDSAPPLLAYRVFRDGTPIIIRDRRVFSDRLSRAILEYLDYQPIEEVFTRGVLRARHGR